MIIHTFFTNGLLGGAEVFIKSFALYHNKDMYKLVASTRDLKTEQIKKVESGYDGDIEVINKSLDIDKIQNELEVDKNTILKGKKQIEISETNRTNYLWKLRIAFIERYCVEMPFILNKYKNMPIIHVDIDSYGRSDFSSLFEEMLNHDISVKFRTKKPGKTSKDTRKTLINFMGFSNTPDVREFFQNGGISEKNRIPLPKMKKGFGQATLGYAYLKYKNKLDGGDLRNFKKYGYNYQSVNMNKKSMMGTGNVGSATESKNKCLADMVKTREKKDG